MSENAVIAGIGCRKGVSAADVLGALDATMSLHGIDYEALECLATGTLKAKETGLHEAAEELQLYLAFADEAMLAACDARLLSRSALSLRETGSACLAEAAALSIGGPQAALLGPRLALGNVTCALARIVPAIPEKTP